MEHIRTHDGLFKFVFSEPEQMAELLRACLPEAVGCAIDWSTLTRVPGNFVDKALKGRDTDLLFTARMERTTVFLYVVPEHKSANDRLVSWQIACYVVRILEQWLRDNTDVGELPAVLPIVVYHGDRPWTSPRSPRDLVDWSLCSPEFVAFLAPLQLHLPYHLLDLSSCDEQHIDDMRLSAVSSLTLRFLQFLRSCPPARVRDYIRAWAPLVGFLTTHPRGQEVLFALWSWYIASSKADLETVRTVMNQMREENPPMRTTLDLLLEDNERRGMAKGLRTMLEGLLRTRFSELPPHVRDRIANADIDSLQRWGLRVLTATSIDEVVADV